MTRERRRKQDGGPLRPRVATTEAAVQRVFAPGELERLYRSLVDHSRDGVFLVQHGVIVFCNDALARALDFSVDELTGTSYVARVAPDDLAAQLERRAARESGSMDTQAYEVRLLRRDGMPRLFEVRAGAVVYRGEPASIGTMRDVTDERAQQRRLAQAEEHYRLALWGSGDRLFDWDLATGTLREIHTSDDREVIGAVPMPTADGLKDWVHPEDYPGYRGAIEAHVAGRTPYFEAAYRLRNREGDWKWKLARGMIVARDADGVPLRMSGTQKDISRLKVAESALRELTSQLEVRVQERTRELQEERLGLKATNLQLERAIEELKRTQGELIEAEKMASLGRLVAGVAHEVNTPLGVGTTAISFLRAQLASLRTALDPGVGAARTHALLAPLDEAALMAENNIARAANLVRSFKQVAVDQSSSVIRTIPLFDYLGGILQSLHPLLRKAGHTIEVTCDPLLEITSRPDALYQVVSNLVMNSLLHGYADGRSGRIAIDVHLEASRPRETLTGGDDAQPGSPQPPEAPPDPDEVRIAYEDDGDGMDAAVAARVFEPFFTTRRELGGTGLGMHIVWNLVHQALRGRIVLRTAPGAGVRFDIVFPRAHPDAR